MIKIHAQIRHNCNHRNVQQLSIPFIPRFSFGGSSAIIMASSKTSFKPICKLRKEKKRKYVKIKKEIPNIYFLFFFTWVNAEHSKYLAPFNCFWAFSPSSVEMGCFACFANLFRVASSSLRSVFNPTSKNGVFGQCLVISGTHYKEIKTLKNRKNILFNYLSGFRLKMAILKYGWN